MLFLKTTVKNDNRRHIELWNEENDTLYNNYVYNNKLQETILKWAKSYKDVFLTNDIDIIKIMRDNGFDYYDID